MLIPRYTSFAEYYHIFTVPFAAMGIGLGFWWLFQIAERKEVRRWYHTGSIIAAVVLILLFTLRSYRGNLIIWDQPSWDCSQYVKKLVPADALIIVSTTSVAVEPDGTPNNYQEPNVFFYSHRYGWSLPADWHTVQQVVDYQNQGAQFFVIVDPSPLHNSPDLEKYLETNAQQIGPGEAKLCSIYHLQQTG